MPRMTGKKEASGRLHAMAGREKVELVGQALFAGAELIKAEASHLVTRYSVSGANHVVSKPGQPPNEDTGGLRSGFVAARTGPLRAEFSSNSPHAVPLEKGTHNMVERPHVGPAVKAKRKEIVEKVQRAVSIAIRKRK